MINKKGISLHPQSSNNDGAIAQLVEQRTENPCVPGSIPGGTTLNKQNPDFETKSGFFVFIKHTKSGNNKYIRAHPINSGERKKILSLHHGKFNVRVFGKLHAAIQYIIPFYNSKSRK